MGEVHIKRDYSVPAAIQFKNPGAMWPGTVATKWGSTKWQYLSDGTGQGGGGHGNKIAIFDTWIDGICAQLDLWRTSPNYKNKSFATAIHTWSGGNNVPSYIRYLKARVPGLTETTVMNDAFWRGPMAIPFLKAQSGHEAGKTIPAPDADWVAAQKRAFSGVPTVNTIKKAGGSLSTTIPTTMVLHSAGLSLPWALGIGVAVAVGIFIYWKFRNATQVANPITPVAPEAPVEPVQPIDAVPVPTQPTP